MRFPLFPLCLVLFATAFVKPAFTQEPVPVPAGWQAQKQADGTLIYSPPDLGAGEIHQVSFFLGLPMKGKSLETWIRDFAPSVGEKEDELEKPMQVEVTSKILVSAVGVYSGEPTPRISVVFRGVSLDGKTIYLMRSKITTDDRTSKRYGNTESAMIQGLFEIAEKANETRSKN